LEPDPYSWNILTFNLLGVSAAPVFSFLLIPFLLLFSALLSGAEKAFFNLPEELVGQYRHSTVKSEMRVWQLLENPRRTMATLFFAKGLTYATLLCLAFWTFWYLTGFTPANGGFTFLLYLILFLSLIFLGEILPKVYYTHHPTALALRLAPVVNFFSKSLIPFTGVFLVAEGTISRKFNLRTTQSPIEDLQEALDATMTEATTTEEKEILQGIVSFGSISVKQIMRSRQEITAFDFNLNLPELIALIEQENYSRVPVYRQSIDTIEGILYIKDLLPHLDAPADFNWQELIRPPFFVPESKKIDDLLKDFQEMRVHMAIVVDEYGGTSGLLTLEDIIEEIVGEIKDEFDDEDELAFTQLDENTYIFDAKTSLHNFCKITGTPYEMLETVKGENESLAGLMLELFSRIPRMGAETKFERFLFKIEAADSKKVKTVRVYVSPENNFPPRHA
jgi:gliding motility-associated protein GldE